MQTLTVHDKNLSESHLASWTYYTQLWHIIVVFQMLKHIVPFHFPSLYNKMTSKLSTIHILESRMKYKIFHLEDYSGSQNCPNVLLFGTDGLDAEWWHKQWFWNFYQTNYTFLALQSTWGHVIWIKTHGVMSRTILWLIGTVLWASIFLHVLPLLKPKTISNVTVGTINNVMWYYLY